MPHPTKHVAAPGDGRTPLKQKSAPGRSQVRFLTLFGNQLRRNFARINARPAMALPSNATVLPVSGTERPVRSACAACENGALFTRTPCELYSARSNHSV